jgi:hypothetical protein
MATEAQVKFFDKLLEEKEFGNADLTGLRQQFSELNKKSASAWIEKAMNLPKRDETHDPITSPTF